MTYEMPYVKIIVIVVLGLGLEFQGQGQWHLKTKAKAKDLAFIAKAIRSETNIHGSRRQSGHDPPFTVLRGLSLAGNRWGRPIFRSLRSWLDLAIHTLPQGVCFLGFVRWGCRAHSRGQPQDWGPNSLSTLSQKSATVLLSQKSETVSQKPDCRRKVRLPPNSATVAVFCDSLTFVRQSHFCETVWTGLKKESRRRNIVGAEIETPRGSRGKGMWRADTSQVTTWSGGAS